MLPHEHGAWVILIAPILIGLLHAPAFSAVSASLFVLGALASFLLRTPLQALMAKPNDRRARGWLAFYAALTAVAFSPLIMLFGRWKLLFFAVPAGLLLANNLTANISGRRFSAFNESTGVLGLCLGAPAVYYSVSFELTSRAWSLWLLCSAFFLGPIFHVKLAALQHRAVADKSVLPALERMRRLSTAYHGLTLTVVSVWAASGGQPALVAIPFAAAFLKTVLRGFHAPARTDFKSLGYMEVGYSIIFVVAMSY